MLLNHVCHRLCVRCEPVPLPSSGTQNSRIPQDHHTFRLRKNGQRTLLSRLLNRPAGVRLLLVQRLFSMFPTGLVGVALLILRLSVATTIVINAAECWASTLSSWIIVGLILAALSLCLGLLTPYFSLLSSMLQTGVLLYAGGNRFQFVTSIVGGGIVSVLGPGAYSVDCRIFGRRLLTLSTEQESTGRRGPSSK
jgi:hypothetical protein